MRGKSVHDYHRGYRSIERGKLKLSITITAAAMILEAAGGFLTNSLALLSDAGHMLTHVFALGISYGAIVIASKQRSQSQTYGLYRAEILAALFNSIFLFAVTAYIFFEGIQRLIHPEPVLSLQMIVIAAVGLTVNLTSVLILRGSEKGDLNVRGAFLHMLADTISSVAILAGGIIVHFTHWYLIDPSLSLLIGAVIFFWAWGLFRESTNVLLENAPKEIDTELLSDDIKKQIPEVREIRDIHVWVITSNMYSFTAHIKVHDMSWGRAGEIRQEINDLLSDKYGIEHTTIQLEP